MEKQSQLPSLSRINDNAMEYLKQFGHERNLVKFMRIHSPIGSNINDGGASIELYSSCATQFMTAIVSKNSSCCSNAMNCDSFDGSCMQMLFDDELHSTSASAFKTSASLQTHREEKSDCTGQVQTNNDKVIRIDIKKQLENKKLCASVDNLQTLQTPQKIHAATKCTQTPESIIKLHKRLEWDSFGDVGYKKSSSTSNINTLERSVLKEIFHDGSARDHSNKSKVNASESDLKSLQNEQTTSTPLASSTFVNLPHCRRGTQIKSTQTVCSKLPKMHDQSVQTSVQRKSMESQSLYVGSSATPSSFEYFSSPSPPNATSNNIRKKSINTQQIYNTQLNEMYAEHMANQENQDPMSSNTAACADIRKAAQSIATEDEENVTIQDGTANQSLSSKCLSNTEFRSSDLDMGVKLLCSLVDAKSLGHRQKRELIKEIVKRISGIDSAASTNSTNTTTTTANTASRRSNRYFVSPRLQQSNNDKGSNPETDSSALMTRQGITNVESPTNIEDNLIQTIENEINNVENNNTIISESFRRKTINQKRINNATKPKVDNSQKIKKSTVPSSNVVILNNKKSETEKDLMEQRIMREWLDPMTRSEIEYEGKQHNRKKHHTTPKPTMGDGKIVDTEHRNSQLNWVETEIKRLEDLRKQLSKESMPESSNSNAPDKLKVTASLSGDKRETQSNNVISINDHIYDSVVEDKDLVTYRKTFEKTRSRFDKIALSKTKSKESSTKIIPIHREIAAHSSGNLEVEKNARTALLSSSAFQAQRAKVPTPIQNELSTDSSSCGNVDPVESVCSLVQQRKREFMEHYNNKKRKQLELLKQQQQEEEGINNNRRLLKSCQQQHQHDMQDSCQLFKHCHHVISVAKRCNKRCCICINAALKNKKNKDGPTSTHIYSQFVPVIEEGSNNNNWPSTKDHNTHVTATTTRTTTKTTAATTTLATMTNMRSSSKSSNDITSKSGSTVHNCISISKTSSSIFGVSSDISIPMGTSYSGGTTTVTSTTHQYDDVAGLCAPSCRNIGVQTSTSTRSGFKYQSKADVARSNFNVNNSQSACVQVRPRSIAYCIEFTTEGHPYTTHIDSKSSIVAPIAETVTSRTSTEPILSLQDHLQRSRPNFCAQSKERKSILNRMQIMRAQRKKELESIIENTSFTSLDRRLEGLPPAATSCIRVFSTREMKALTSKRCEVLPEVVERQQRKKEENRRRNNRILRDIFNSRLQRRVRSGKISLNHSLTII